MSSLVLITIAKKLINSIFCNIKLIKKISLFVLFYFLIHKQIQFFNKTKILFKNCEKNQDIIKSLIPIHYKPTIYLPTFMMQLIFHEISPIPKMSFVREYIQVSDGGVISFDWVINKNPEKKHDKLLIILHGLSGGSETNYLREIISGFLKKGGYKIVIIHNRGINDTPLFTSIPFHAAFTSDLKHSIQNIRSRYPETLCFCLGVSMGANIFTKLLAYDYSFNDYIKCFVSISNPLNLFESEKRNRHTILGNYIYLSLKSYLEKHTVLRTNQYLNYKIIKELKTYRELDNEFTCKIHGFENVDNYYKSTSSGYDIRHLIIPSLFINSYDDLLAPVDTIDLKACNKEIKKLKKMITL